MRDSNCLTSSVSFGLYLTELPHLLIDMDGIYGVYLRLRLLLLSILMSTILPLPRLNQLSNVTIWQHSNLPLYGQSDLRVSNEQKLERIQFKRNERKP